MVHGKSTLVKCIVGLNKVPKGTIVKNTRIGYLPQKTEIQRNFPASIEEVVLSGTTTNSLSKIWYTKEDRKKAENIMRELNIYDIRKKCFRDLSGGQQQRVLIARAMCATEELLILDEPTNGLDPVIAKQIYEILKDLNEKRNMTIVMVSHDVDRAMNYSKRVVKIRNGQKIYDNITSKYNLEGDKKND